MQRRLEDDDQWVVPHSPCLAMMQPSSCNVLPFDPIFGADQCRSYAVIGVE